MNKSKKLNIIRGGIAKAIPNMPNYYFMKGLPHELGGIDIGKNLEVEGNEVVHVGKDNIKVYSSVPFLNGKSPAEKVLGGDNPTTVFREQEQFKKVNGLNDDGTKKELGGEDKYSEAQKRLDEAEEIRRSLISDEEYSRLKENANKSQDKGYSKFSGYLQSMVDNDLDLANNIKDEYRNAQIKQEEEFKEKTYPYKLMGKSIATAGELLSSAYMLGKGVRALGFLPNNRILNGIYQSDKGQIIANTLGTVSDTYQLLTANNNTEKIENSIELPADIAGIVGGTNWFRNTPLFGRYGNKIDNVLDLAGYTAAGYDLIYKPVKHIFEENFITNDKNMKEKEYNKNYKFLGGEKNNKPKPNTYRAGGLYSLTVDGQTKMHQFPSTGESFARSAKGKKVALLGTASNIIGSIISHGINKSMLNDLEYSPKPITRRANKLKTKININPQIDAMRESLAEYRKHINDNTASSRTARALMNRGLLNYNEGFNNIYATKENQETELINKDKLNQQEVANANIKEFNDWNNNRVAFNNTILEKKSENDIGLIGNINSAIQNAISRKEKRFNERQNTIATLAKYPNVNPRMLKDLGYEGISDELIERWEKINKKIEP